MERDWASMPLDVYYDELASGLEALASWPNRDGDREHMLEAASAFKKLSKIHKRD